MKKSNCEIEMMEIDYITGKQAKEAGVDILVSGTTLFKDEKNLKDNIDQLRNC